MAGTVAVIVVEAGAGAEAGAGEGSGEGTGEAEGDDAEPSSPEGAVAGTWARKGAGIENRPTGTSDAFCAPPQAATVAAAMMARHPLTREMLLGFEDMDLRVIGGTGSRSA